MTSISLAAILLTAMAPAPKGSASAGDWPQWRGPNRDGHSTSTGLLQKWPEGGPKLVYKMDKIGAGYGSPAIAAGKLIIMGTENLSKEKTDGDTEVVFCLDPLTGKQIWKTPIGDVQKFDRGGGSRGTPTIDGDSVYVLDPKGVLVCLKVADGTKVWSTDLMSKEIGGGRPGWGFSESVLVDGNNVICTPGGGKGTLAALDKKNGNVVWRSEGIKDPAGYSSIIIAELEGVKHYIQQSMKGTFGVNPADGKVLWNVINKAYAVAVAPTPVFYKDHVFATAGYGAGCKLIKLSKSEAGIKAEEIYDSKIIANHHGGVVQVDDYLYGSNERKWICLKFVTTSTSPAAEWISDKQDKGSVSYADGCLYTYGESKGEVVLVKADPKDWKEAGRFTVPEKSELRPKSGRYWAHPVIANGKLYLRDHEWLFCYDVTGKE